MKLMGIFPYKKENVATEKVVEETAVIVVPEMGKGGAIKRKYGFFGTKEKAENKNKELETKGIKTHIKEISVKGSTRYVPEED